MCQRKDPFAVAIIALESIQDPSEGEEIAAADAGLDPVRIA